MKRSVLVLGGFLMIGILAGCATPTPYAPANPAASNHEGYTETRIEDNRYHLKFSGNVATPRETVETYMLYRAAELTLMNGFDYFTVVTRSTQSQKHETATFEDGYWRPYGRFSWRYYRGGWGPWGSAIEIDSHTYEQFEAEGEIVMSKGKKPDNDANAYDARQVKANLETKIVRPKAG
jgi:hypothetical protein